MKQTRLQTGLGTMAIFGIIIGACVVLGIIMIAATTKPKEATDDAEVTVVSADGSEWTEYASSTIKLKVKHPGNWTVEPAGTANCLNNTYTMLKPPTSLLESAKPAVSSSVPWRYHVSLKQLGTPEPGCTAGDLDLQTIPMGSMKSLDRMAAGPFKGKYLTLLGIDGQTQPSVGLLTTSKYDSGTQLKEAANLRANDTDYIVGVVLEPLNDADQDKPVTIKPEQFKQTELYKQSKAIIEALR